MSYYFFISLIFSLSAFGIYFLSKLYVKTIYGAFFAGFVFTCCNFTFANIDDSIVLLYFLTAFSIYFLKRFIETKKNHHLIYSAIIGGLQIYFSLYVFIFQTIILLIIILLNIKDLYKEKKSFFLFKSSLLYLLFALPFFLFYLYALMVIDVVNPWSLDRSTHAVISVCSLRLKDLFSLLPNNLIYNGERPDILFWPHIRRKAFIGFLSVSLALLSLKKFSKEKTELIIIGLTGLILSSGQEFQIGDSIISSPFYYLYNICPLFAIIRVPLRAYFLFLFSISILSGSGLEYLSTFFKDHNKKVMLILLAVCLIIHSIENISFPMISFNIQNYAKILGEYSDFFSDKIGSIVIDLPSDTGVEFKDSGNQLFVHNREIIYMNWQTEHMQNIIGGVNGYYPASRMKIQKYVEQLPEPHALSMLTKLGVGYIVFHKKMLLFREYNLYDSLKKSPYLAEAVDTENLTVFKVVQKEVLLKMPSKKDEITIYRDEQKSFFETLRSFLNMKKK